MYDGPSSVRRRSPTLARNISSARKPVRMSARSRFVHSLRRRGSDSELRAASRAATKSAGSAFGSVLATFGRARSSPWLRSLVWSRPRSERRKAMPASGVGAAGDGQESAVVDGSRPRSGPSHATASAMVASMGLVASPSRGVVAWRRSMPGGAGVIVISRKRTGLQSHDSSIGCAIALGQSGLACVVLGSVLDLTLCSAGSSTQ